MTLRHEWKHRLSPGDLPELRQRLRCLTQPDPHGVDGKYEIRSLYFDTPADTALREKLDGVNAATVSLMSQKLNIEADDARFDEIMQQVVKACRKVEPDCRILL